MSSASSVIGVFGLKYIMSSLGHIPVIKKGVVLITGLVPVQALLRLLETCLCNLIKVNKWHAQTWPRRAIKTELRASEPQPGDLRHLCQLS